jgi:hypothetical protein
MDEPFVHRGIIVEYAVDVVGYYLNVVDVLVNVVILIIYLFNEDCRQPMATSLMKITAWVGQFLY